MAYSRWGRGSNWYVFWECTKSDTDAASAGNPKPKSEERLAIWHSQHKATPSYTYAEVREMLVNGDFARITGFEDSSRALLHECMTKFVEDVDRDT